MGRPTFFLGFIQLCTADQQTSAEKKTKEECASFGQPTRKHDYSATDRSSQDNMLYTRFPVILQERKEKFTPIGVIAGASVPQRQPKGGVTLQSVQQ